MHNPPRPSVSAHHCDEPARHTAATRRNLRSKGPAIFGSRVDSVLPATRVMWLAAAAILLTIDASAQSVVTFQQGANGYQGARDTELWYLKPSRNVGNDATIKVDGAPDFGAVLSWDITSIPSGSTVQSASIQFYITSGSSDEYYFYEALRPWAEDEATWNNYANGAPWQVPGADGSKDRNNVILGVLSPASTGYYSVTLNAAGRAVVQSWINNSGSNHGFVVSNYGPSDDVAFYTSEASSVASRPKLTVTYSGGSGNVAPNAVITATPVSGHAPLLVSFDASSSFDPDGSIVSYSWNFGDGSSPGSGVSPTHTYTAAGTYAATVTVTDNGGLTDAATISVAVQTAQNVSNFAEFLWSGGITEQSALVKARVPSSTTARLIVSTNSQLSNIIATSGFKTPRSTDDYVLTLTASGLSPDTRYFYSLESQGGLRSTLMGSFRTSPNSSCASPYQLKIAVSGDSQGGSNDSIFETILNRDPDLFIHLGDMHYEGSSTSRLSTYRSAYRTTLSSPRQSALYRNVPIEYVWDDNDYGPNDSDSTFAFRSEAKRAFVEYVPRHPLVSDALNQGVYRAFSMGRVRVIVTDVRFHRSPESNPDNANKVMLGNTQKAWFKQELLNAGATHKMIIWVNSTPWIAGRGSPDTWGGYTTERAELANFIDANGLADKIVMLSADAHMVAIDDGSNSAYGTGPTSTGFGVFHAAPLDQSGSYFGGPFSHGAKTGNSQYGLLTITDNCGSSLTANFTGYNDQNQILVSSNSFPNGGHTLSYSWTSTSSTNNTAPTITAIANQVILENTSTAALPFSVNDAESNPATLIVTASSNNQTLLPNANLLLNGSNAPDWTITATPAPNRSGGPVTVTVTVGDGLLTAVETFSVTVAPNTGLVATSFQQGVNGYLGARDTELWYLKPSRNVGDYATIKVDGAPDFGAVLSWDITQIPSGSTVESVTIAFDITSGTSDEYYFYEARRPWVEDEATWNNYASGAPWQVAGADGPNDRNNVILGILSPPTTGAYTVTLNAAGRAVVQSWINSPATNHGFVISNYGPSDDVVFYASEASAVTSRPKLTITYSGSGGPYAKVTDDVATLMNSEELVNDRFQVDQINPNPFSSRAVLRFGVREPGHVRANLYDLQGRRIQSLYDAVASAGAWEQVSISADGLASGVYLVTVEGDGFREIRKVVLIR